MRETLRSRLEKRLVKDGSCLIWTGAVRKDKNGLANYGAIQIGARGQGVDRPHRVAYRFAKGEIPKGLVVMHSCNNKLCCNPDHLTAGTYSENIKDAWDDGLRPSNSKFSEEQIIEMRKMRDEGKSCQAIADLFGLSNSGAWKIVTGRCWAHL